MKINISILRDRAEYVRLKLNAEGNTLEKEYYDINMSIKNIILTFILYDDPDILKESIKSLINKYKEINKLSFKICEYEEINKLNFKICDCENN